MTPATRKSPKENRAGPALGRVPRRLLIWFRKQARNLPWRRARDAYGIWVSEIMLQQTQVKTVIPYWERWMQTFPTIQALADAPLDAVVKCWEGLGYYSRARNLQRAAVQLLRDHHGQLPRTQEDLRGLPGIGRYTAGAVCSIAFEQPAPAVDGNVRRVLLRVLGLRTAPEAKRTQERLWRTAAELVAQAAGLRAVSERPCGDFNQALMELGAVICTPRAPTCGRCPIRSFCTAHALGLTESIPGSRQTPSFPVRHVAAFVVERRGRLYLRQRPTTGVNAGLWEFPNALVPDASEAAARRAAEQELGVGPATLEAGGSFFYGITRYRYRLTVYWWGSSAPGATARGCWLNAGEIAQRALPSVHRKIWERIISPELPGRRHPGAGASAAAGCKPARRREPDHLERNERDLKATSDSAGPQRWARRTKR